MQKTTKSPTFVLLNQLLEPKNQSKQEDRSYPIFKNFLFYFKYTGQVVWLKVSTNLIKTSNPYFLANSMEKEGLFPWREKGLPTKPNLKRHSEYSEHGKFILAIDWTAVSFK